MTNYSQSALKVGEGYTDPKNEITSRSIVNTVKEFWGWRVS